MRVLNLPGYPVDFYFVPDILKTIETILLDPEAYSDMNFSPVKNKGLSEFVTGEWFRTTWSKVGYKLFGERFDPKQKGLNHCFPFGTHSFFLCRFIQVDICIFVF